MDRLIQKLAKAGVVGIDTPVFIYHIESHPKYSPLTQGVFSTMEKGKWMGVTSAIALMEINVHPWQAGREEVARKYEALLVNFPNLRIVNIDRDVARIASQLRAKVGVRPPAALQVAASLMVDAKLYLTNDRRLSSLQSVIDVAVLDDYL